MSILGRPHVRQSGRTCQYVGYLFAKVIGSLTIEKWKAILAQEDSRTIQKQMSQTRDHRRNANYERDKRRTTKTFNIWKQWCQRPQWCFYKIQPPDLPLVFRKFSEALYFRRFSGVFSCGLVCISGLVRGMLACLAGCLSVCFTCLLKSCAPHCAARCFSCDLCAPHCASRCFCPVLFKTWHAYISSYMISYTFLYYVLLCLQIQKTILTS